MSDKITMIELFSGIGAQERALRQVCDHYEIINTCDCDKDAVLSYAAMRFNLEEEMKTFDFPSKEQMIEELQAKNVGYDFQKSKHSITSRTSENKIKQYYLADRLGKNLGDISKVEALPYADIVTYSFPCFVPGTMVLTDNGYKNIEDIQEGDMVLTHTNQYQKVIKPMKNYCNSFVYKIDTMCSDPIYTTEEHPFYIRERYWKYSKDCRYKDGASKGKEKKQRLFTEPKWVKAKDLTRDCYVGIAINQKSEIPKWDGMMFHWSDGRKDRYSNKLKKYMDNPDFWWVVGRYLGDGWLVDGYGSNPSYGIKICCAKEETYEITDVLDRLYMNYTVASEKTVNKIQISMKELYEFCLQFGRGAKNKHLTSTVLNLPVNLLSAFLNGYISADGCFTQNKFKMTSISRELLYGVGQCVAKVYHMPFSMYKTERPKTCVIEGRTVNQKDSYDLTFKTYKAKQDKAFYEDGYIWCPINHISTKDYNGYVYNMEVENDNSYVVQNIIVHNCTDLSVAGKGEGMTLKCDKCGHSWPIDFSSTSEKNICPNCGNEVTSSTRSGLLAEVQRLLSISYQENTLPKYLALENVKNLVGKKFIGQFNDWLKWLDSIGYNTHYKVLNAKNFGIPQNRERIFAISIRKDIDDGTFQFPSEIPLTTRLKDILETNVSEQYYISNERVNQILNSDFLQEKLRARNNISDENPVRLTNIYGEQFGTGYAGNVWDKNGLSPTLQTAQGGNRQPLVVDEGPFIVASRGRNPDNPSDRTTGAPTEQRLEPNLNGTTNCLTSVAKDNYVVEPQVLRAERTEYGKAIRKQYEAGEIEEKIGNMREMRPRTDGIANTITTVQKDNYVCEPIVCEERRDEGIRFFKDGCCGTLRTIDACGDKRVLEPDVTTIKVRNQATEFAGCTDVAGTLMARDYKGFGNQEMSAVVENYNNIKYRIRKLTPTECWRLMGFTDEDCNRAAKYVSASSLYKQAGNSIVTNCLVAIFYSLFYKDSSDAYSKYLIDFNSHS